MAIEYTNEFYALRNDSTTYAANEVLSRFLAEAPPIRSAIDFGCGVGTWLSVLKQRGVERVFGVDGPWVDQSLLQIDQGDFEVADMSSAVPSKQGFDLAISLEVAEHLPPQSAEGFVEALTGAAEIVLFSAAIPDQGGVNHLNERWQHYWAGLFEKKGYTHLDFIRPAIWNDRKISFWYKQNILVYAKQERVAEFSDFARHNKVPLSIVHPELASYLAKKETPEPSFNQCASIMSSKMVKRVKRMVGSN